MPSPPPEDDDDFELELEPVDPDILAHERERAQAKTDAAVTKATFDELYEHPPENHDYDLDFSQLRQFRFTTRHLLILTAILAIGLTLYLQLGGCMALFVMAAAAVGCGYFVIYRKERREALELERRRKEFLAQGPAPARPAADDDGPWEAEPPEPSREFRFAFSLKQVMITMTAAAVFLAVLRFVNVEALTLTLGLLALVGLAVQTFGFVDPPPAVVFGWWILLVLYLALGLLAAFFPNLLHMGLAPVAAVDAAGRWC
jgi:hypothetical protein